MRHRFWERYQAARAKYRDQLASRGGRIAAGLELVAQVPSAVEKVRSARRGPNRVFVGAREAVRMVGRAKFGPLWNVGERVLKGIGRLFRRRRRRRPRKK